MSHVLGTPYILFSMDFSRKLRWPLIRKGRGLKNGIIFHKKPSHRRENRLGSFRCLGELGIIAN